MSEINEVTISTDEAQQSVLHTKFKGDVDAMEKSYLELERQFTQSRQNPSTSTGETAETTPETEVKPTETSGDTKETSNTPFGEGITSALSTAGIDAAELQATFEKTGELPEDSRKQLDAIFGKETVEYYMQGLKASQQQVTEVANQAADKVLEVVGGEEAWVKVSNWAAEGSPELAEAFNKALDAGDGVILSALASAMKSQYESQNGSLGEPTSVKAGAAAVKTGVAQPFEDNSQWIAAVQDPRYATSEAYRREVGERLKASTFAS